MAGKGFGIINCINSLNFIGVISDEIFIQGK